MRPSKQKHSSCTRKTRFGRETDARMKVQELQTNKNTCKYMRVYSCEICAGWHLTGKIRKG